MRLENQLEQKQLDWETRDVELEELQVNDWNGILVITFKHQTTILMYCDGSSDYLGVLKNVV